MKHDNASDEHKLWLALPGGADVLAWFGDVPDFHDAEIVSLKLDRGGPSQLAVHFFRLQRSEAFTKAVMEPTGDAIVTFEFDYIVDLKLEGFGLQNVIAGLWLRRASPDPARAPYYSIDHSVDDFEIELEPCYGMSGTIRTRSVRLALTPGSPNPPRLTR